MTRVLSSGVKRLSQLVIDDDLRIGAHKLKTTHLLLKENTPGYMALRDTTDTDWRSLTLFTIQLVGDIAFAQSTKRIVAPNYDDAYIGIDAWRNTVGLQEIARLAGGATEAFELLKGKLTGTLKANAQLITNPAVASEYAVLGGVVRRKSADQTVNNDTSLVNDSHLYVNLGANEIWRLELWLLFNSSSVADLKLGWTYPAGCTAWWWTSEMMSPVASGSPFTKLAITNTRTISGLGTDTMLEVHAVIMNAATAGLLSLAWAQSTLEETNTIMKANSSLVGHRIA